MARDRQRAKQRRARRRETVPPGTERQARDDASNIEYPGREDRADQPGASPDPLAHASADVDEVDARLAVSADAAALPEAELDPSELEIDQGHEDAEEALGRPAGGRGGRGGRRGRPVAEEGMPARREPRSTPSTAKLPLPLRFVAFLRASWAELQRVQWPDRRQVTQATGVVVLFVIIAGAWLGIADWLAQKVVNVII